MLGFGVAFDDSQQVEMLAGIEIKLVGFFNNCADVGVVDIAVSIIKTDQGHEVKTASLATKQREYFSSVKVVVTVEIFFTNKRVALGFEEDPQAAIDSANKCLNLLNSVLCFWHEYYRCSHTQSTNAV